MTLLVLRTPRTRMPWSGVDSVTASLPEQQHRRRVVTTRNCTLHALALLLVLHGASLVLYGAIDKLHGALEQLYRSMELL